MNKPMQYITILIYIFSIILPLIAAFNVFKDNDESYVANRFLEFMLILSLSLIPFINTFMTLTLITAYYEKKNRRKV